MKLPTVTSLWAILLLAFQLPLLTACSSPAKPFYAKDSFGGNSPYQKHMPDPADLACAAAKRTLLGDGYIIEDTASRTAFKGKKAYRINGDRSTFLEMSVVCLADPEGSSVFANGLISTYDLKKAASSASIGVSVIGSVSLPIGQSVDSRVKVSEETITDREFYRRFFSSVQGRLDRMRLESPRANESMSVQVNPETKSEEASQLTAANKPESPTVMPTATTNTEDRAGAVPSTSAQNPTPAMDAAPMLPVASPAQQPPSGATP